VKVLTDAKPDELQELVRRREPFWLDLVNPSRESVDALVESIGLDPRAAERALRFGAEPELRRFRDHAALVFYGARKGEDARALLEVHIFVRREWVVTIRRDECTALDELRGEAADTRELQAATVAAWVLDALAGTFAALLDPLDDRIEAIEEAAAGASDTSQPTRELRTEILRRRRRLLRLRRVVRRQRDYVDRAVEELSELPGAEGHDFRDVSGLMIRVGDRIDDSLDTLAASLDLLNSTLSNRMNLIMERLTIVATIFLPLSVVTGFFGMNFDWMVQRIDTLATFLGLGVGVFVGSGVAIWLWVRSRLSQRVSD
jgi:magnesium transporter